MAETRATSYLAIALRRCGRVDAALDAAQTALEAAHRIDSGYYRGHAHAVMGWSRWRRGETEKAENLLNEAFDLWGRVERDGETFADVEFSWLAAWPLCAIKIDRGDAAAAAAHLSWLGAPWERPMTNELGRAVDMALLTPSIETIAAALSFAEAERLL